jgi:hypothetical protein
MLRHADIARQHSPIKKAVSANVNTSQDWATHPTVVATIRQLLK